jgi:hypothetical protein
MTETENHVDTSAEAEAMREACAVRVAHLPASRYEGAPCEWIRALPLPTPDALSRVRAEAIKEADNPDWDSTDAAHPAWWRGNDAGVEAVVKIVSGILDGDKPGTHGSKTLTALVHRIARLRAEGERTGMEAARDMIAHRPDAYHELDARIRAMAQESKP